MELENIFSSFMGIDNAARHEAEKRWEFFCNSSPDLAAEGLCIILRRRDSKTNEVYHGYRALAAVLLRSLLRIQSRFWFSLQLQTQHAVRDVLIQCVAEEPVIDVRLKIIHTISQLASITFAESDQDSSQNAWPQLLTLIKTLCEHSEPYHLECGLILVDRVFEYAPEYLKSYAHTLASIFSSALLSSSGSVRIASLRATCSMLQECDFNQDEGSTPAFIHELMLISKMLVVIETAAIDGSEEASRSGLESLCSLADSRPFILKSYVDTALQCAVHLAKNSNLEPETRKISFEFILMLCESMPPVVRKSGMIPSILNLIFVLLLETDEEEEADVTSWARNVESCSEEEDNEIRNMAASALNRIALALGGDAVLSPSAPLISSYLGNTGDWRYRRAALLALAMLGEGCSRALYPLLDTIVLPVITTCAADSHPQVRYQLYNCLGQMSADFSEPDIGEPSFQALFHPIVLPVLANALCGINNGMPLLKAAVASAISYFCHPLYCQLNWLLPSARDLLSGLLMLIQDGTQKDINGLFAVEEALTAVSQISQILGSGFESFYSHFVGIVKNLVLMPTKDTKSEHLRGKALESFALMGQSVGIDLVRADAHAIMQALVSSHNGLESIQASYSLTAYARIASVLKEEFRSYFTLAMTQVIKALSTNSSFQLHDFDEDILSNSTDMPEKGITKVKCAIRGIGTQVLCINTTAAQEKKIALQALYQYAESFKSDISKFSLNFLDLVLPNLDRANTSDVRIVSAAVVAKLVSAGSSGGGEGQSLLDRALPRLVESMEAVPSDGEDEELMECICVAADALCECLQIVSASEGFLILHDNYVEPIVNGFCEAMRAGIERYTVRAKKERIDVFASEDREGAQAAAESEKEFDEWEHDMLTSCTDGLGWIIKIFKSSFLPMYETMAFPIFTSLAYSPYPESQRALALCSFIDIMEHCSPDSQRHAHAIFEACLEGLKSQSSALRQASAYGMGVLAVYGGNSVSNNVAGTLELLLDIATRGKANLDYDDNDGMLSDNAISAAFSICIQFSHMIPAHMVILGIFQRLPLKNDIEEGRKVLQTVIELVKSGNPLVTSNEILPLTADFLIAVMEFRPKERADDDLDSNFEIYYDNEDEMWESQFTTKESRYQVESILHELEKTNAGMLKTAWSKAGERSKIGMQTTTEIFSTKL